MLCGCCLPAHRRQSAGPLHTCGRPCRIPAALPVAHTERVHSAVPSRTCGRPVAYLRPARRIPSGRSIVYLRLALSHAERTTHRTVVGTQFYRIPAASSIAYLRSVLAYLRPNPHISAAGSRIPAAGPSHTCGRPVAYLRAVLSQELGRPIAYLRAVLSQVAGRPIAHTERARSTGPPYRTHRARTLDRAGPSHTPSAHARSGRPCHHTSAGPSQAVGRPCHHTSTGPSCA
jgi:hypothetical protein